MYKLNNISLSNFGIIPGRAEGSTLALSGFLDMPKRLGKTFHSWGDENGVEPYVSASEIHFGGRNIEFYGLIKSTSKANAFVVLNNFFSLIDSFTDVVYFETPYGTFKVRVNSKIAIKYLGGGWCTLMLKFREPVVLQPSNFVAVGFVAAGFFATSELNRIVENYATPSYTVYGVDGIPFDEIGCFVKNVVGNFNRASLKEPTVTSSTTQELFQVTKTGEKIVKLELVFVASSIAVLKKNTNALFYLLAKEGLRNLQIDGRVIEAFAVKGFRVKNIKSNANMAVAEVTAELIII